MNNSRKEDLENVNMANLGEFSLWIRAAAIAIALAVLFLPVLMPYCFGK